MTLVSSMSNVQREFAPGYLTSWIETEGGNLKPIPAHPDTSNVAEDPGVQSNLQGQSFDHVVLTGWSRDHLARTLAQSLASGWKRPGRGGLYLGIAAGENADGAEQTRQAVEQVLQQAGYAPDKVEIHRVIAPGAAWADRFGWAVALKSAAGAEEVDFPQAALNAARLLQQDTGLLGIELALSPRHTFSISFPSRDNEFLVSTHVAQEARGAAEGSPELIHALQKGKFVVEIGTPTRPVLVPIKPGEPRPKEEALLRVVIIRPASNAPNPAIGSVEEVQFPDPALVSNEFKNEADRILDERKRGFDHEIALLIQKDLANEQQVEQAKVEERNRARAVHILRRLDMEVLDGIHFDNPEEGDHFYGLLYKQHSETYEEVTALLGKEWIEKTYLASYVPPVLIEQNKIPEKIQGLRDLRYKVALVLKQLDVSLPDYYRYDDKNAFVFSVTYGKANTEADIVCYVQSIIKRLEKWQSEGGVQKRFGYNEGAVLSTISKLQRLTEPTTLPTIRPTITREETLSSLLADRENLPEPIRQVVDLDLIGKRILVTATFYTIVNGNPDPSTRRGIEIEGFLRGIEKRRDSYALDLVEIDRQKLKGLNLYGTEYRMDISANYQNVEIKPAAAGAEEVEWDKVKDMSIAELELSVRATNVLEVEGIMTMLELIQRSQRELLGIRNFGKLPLREVLTKLESLGLTPPAPDRPLVEGLTLKQLGLSAPARKSLQKLEIETAGDLRRYSADLLSEVRVSIVYLPEVRTKLAAFGLSLAGERPEKGVSPVERATAIDRVRAEFSKIVPVPGAALAGIGPSQAARHAKLLRAMGQILDPADPALSSIRQRLFVVTKPEEPLLHLILQGNLGIVADNSPLAVAEELRKRFRSVQKLKANYLVAMGTEGAAEQQTLNDAIDLDYVTNAAGPKIEVVPQTTREDLKEFLRNLLATLAGVTVEQVPDRFDLEQLAKDLDLLIKA